MLHNAPFSCFWGPAMLAGATLAMLANLRDDGLAALFHACRPTWMHLPQPLFPKVVKLFAENPAMRASLRGIGTSSGGAEIERVLGVPTHHFYGMTEGIIVYPRFGDPAAFRHSSVGWPIADGDEIRIVHPGTEDEVAPGEPGELVYRGPYVFHGYYNAPVQTASGMTSDGWVRSGDLIQAVTIEGRRGLVYKGRLKDLISRGGEKISCEEVEQYARTHPAILDIVVVPSPCPVYAERGAAFVVVEPGHECPDLAALGRHLGDQGLAKFKWPERLYVIDVLPTTNSGKLDRPGLRRQAAALVEQVA
jgi:non-ribosomal peptide synthetase component E (peptide arylation enzyme)